MPDPEEIPSKCCSKCREIKPLDAFQKNKNTKDGRQCHCKACRAIHAAANADQLREYKRAWHAANAESQHEKMRAYRAANADTIREQKRAWGVANRETRREYERAWRAANPDKHREYHRTWRVAHPGARREYERAHRIANPDLYHAKTHRRLARIKANGGNVTAQELATKRASQNGVCAYCKMPHDPQALTIDHVIPIDHGGPHIIANIVFACGVCNSSKRNRTPEQWTNRWYERKS